MNIIIFFVIVIYFYCELTPKISFLIIKMIGDKKQK